MANLTPTQIQSLNLGITVDDRAALFINAALEFIEDNTTIDISDIENIPSRVKLFVLKYLEITNMRVGVTSESIEGLSQSFGDGNQLALIWDIANELLANDMKSRIRFVAAERKWK